MNRKAASLAVIVILSLAGYGYTYLQVSSAIRNLEIEMADIRIDGFSLFPPSADVVFIYIATNPSDYEFELRVDGNMYYGDTLVTPIDVFDTIRAKGRSTFEVPVHITSGVIGVLLEANDPQLTFEGKVTISHRIFGIIPVVFTSTEGF